MVHRRAVTLLLLSIVAACAVARLQAPPFENEIRAFEAHDRKAPPSEGAVLFVGSSSIRLWTTLARDFPRYPTLNRGFGGSQIADSVRYVDRIVTPYKPRAIVFFAGSNDLAAGKSAKTVFADFRSFVQKVRAKLPRVPIAFVSISPAPSRWSNVESVREANRLIEAYAQVTPGLEYVDVFSPMLDAEGKPRSELFGPDRLHMTAMGYAVWTQAVGRALETMLSHPASTGSVGTPR